MLKTQRQTLEERLAGSERRVADCQQRIKDQRARIAAAALKGKRNHVSDEILDIYELNLSLFLAHRDRLIREIRLLRQELET